MSVSGAMMAASLPPSSSTTGRTAPDAAAITARPVGTPPVNDTMSTPGCDTSISPSSGPGPLTAFTTPGGKASASAAATASTAPGHVGGAFTTTVLPARRAGSTLLPSTDTGQLNGSNAATTPKGSCTTLVRAPAAAERPGGQGLGHQGGERSRHAPDGARVELRLPQHLAVLAGEEGGQVLGLDGGTRGGRRLGHELGALLGCHRRP